MTIAIVILAMSCLAMGLAMAVVFFGGKWFE